jgi:hypothetical protein
VEYLQLTELVTDGTASKTVGNGIDRRLVHKGKRDLKAFWRVLDGEVTNEELPCH